MDSVVNTVSNEEVRPELQPELQPELTPELQPELTPELTPELQPELQPEEKVDDDTCVLVAGLINTDWLPQIIFTHKDIKNKIISLWDSTSIGNVELLHAAGFKVIINRESEFTNIRAQADVCVWTGINKCKEFGYKYVLRMRTDMVSNSVTKYICKTKHLANEKLTVLCGAIFPELIFHSNFVVFGKIDDMIRYFTIMPNDCPHTIGEKFHQEYYANKENLTKSDIQEIFHMSLPICIENNIEFTWLKAIGPMVKKYVDMGKEVIF